jgi:hypothetical protein
MMPMALGLMWLEFWFFSKLVITEEIRPLSAQFALKSADAEKLTAKCQGDLGVRFRSVVRSLMCMPPKRAPSVRHGFTLP